MKMQTLGYFKWKAISRSGAIVLRTRFATVSYGTRAPPTRDASMLFFSCVRSVVTLEINDDDAALVGISDFMSLSIDCDCEKNVCAL
jgi:hypothetical protein